MEYFAIVKNNEIVYCRGINEGEEIILSDGESLVSMTEEQYNKHYIYKIEDDAVVVDQEKFRINRILEIRHRLNEIDYIASRPIRAIINGTDVEYDRTKLSNLEIEAQNLRNELSQLGE